MEAAQNALQHDLENKSKAAELAQHQRDETAAELATYRIGFSELEKELEQLRAENVQLRQQVESLQQGQGAEAATGSAATGGVATGGVATEAATGEAATDRTAMEPARKRGARGGIDVSSVKRDTAGADGPTKLVFDSGDPQGLTGPDGQGQQHPAILSKSQHPAVLSKLF